jgi:hypothetical protein
VKQECKQEQIIMKCQTGKLVCSLLVDCSTNTKFRFVQFPDLPTTGRAGIELATGVRWLLQVGKYTL